MPDLSIHLFGDNAWPDLADKMVHHVTDSMQIARLPGGMKSGKTSVALRIDLPNGQVVVAETSLALLSNAVHAIEAREREEGR